MVPDFSPAQSAHAERASLHWGAFGFLCSPLVLGLACAECASPHRLQMWDWGRDCTVWDSSSLKQTIPIPATGQSCTLMAKEINRPQQFEATEPPCCRAPFPVREWRLHPGLNLNMVTSSLHGHVAVAACWCRLPAKLKRTRRMLLPITPWCSIPGGSGLSLCASLGCFPPAWAAALAGFGTAGRQMEAVGSSSTACLQSGLRWIHPSSPLLGNR